MYETFFIHHNMALEIERKFLVVDDSFKIESYESAHIVQGYICREPGKSVRIRISDNRGYITIKGKSSDNGLSRFEWEKEISLNDANELIKLCPGGVIDKIRYKVKSGDHIFEIDEFFGDNIGLVLAEVELRSINDVVIMPHFIGKEVTGDIRYYNSNLLNNPYITWSK